MSGIVGILNLDGKPVEASCLRHLTDFLAFRGPDAQQMWISANVGFGLALLNTAPEDPHLRHFSPVGGLAIVADARVDGRRELIASLRSHGQQPLDEATDSELILHAYRVWDENCLDHLIGDFVFAIWDGPRRRLFCARDQMGVKPFFYAHLGPLLIFSNTLDCIRQHPAVSDRLDDISVADFLIFDLIQDPAATTFADVRRLQPAHLLLAEPESQRVSVRSYWTPTVAAPVRYRRSSDYVEHFCELLDTAVADRLRAKSACIFMSGGLDSPIVAASASRVSSRDGGSPRVWAYTQVFDSLIPHDERHYAGMVARALKIPIEYRADDDLRLFQFAEQPQYWPPEPVHFAWPNIGIDHLRRVSTESSVVLTGFGADPLLSSRISVHFSEQLRQGHWGAALADAARYLSAEGRLSRLYLRTRWRILFASRKTHSGFFPQWLNEDFVRNLGLRERWANPVKTVGPADAVRPEAHEVTFSTFWPDLFNWYDPGVTRVPVEVRYPFFDLRLMNFLLSLPRLPWCCDKQLLREAARGVLPDAVRLRRKSPLRASPLLKLLTRPQASWVDGFDPSAGLERYVVRSRIPAAQGENDSWTAWINLRPLSLDYWLRGLNRSAMQDASSLECESTTSNRS